NHQSAHKNFLELNGLQYDTPLLSRGGEFKSRNWLSQTNFPYFAQRKPIVVARRSGSLKSRVSTVLISECPPMVLGGSSSQPETRTPRYRPVSGPCCTFFGMNAQALASAQPLTLSRTFP